MTEKSDAAALRRAAREPINPAHQKGPPKPSQGETVRLYRDK